jgi:predicted transcriptional regulator
MGKNATTIRISAELRDKLKELGKKGETYEEVIERVLKVAQSNRGGRS